MHLLLWFFFRHEKKLHFKLEEMALKNWIFDWFFKTVFDLPVQFNVKELNVTFRFNPRQVTTEVKHLLRNCLLSLRSSSWRLVDSSPVSANRFVYLDENRKPLMTHQAVQSLICLEKILHLSKIIIGELKESCFCKQLCPCFVANVICLNNTEIFCSEGLTWGHATFLCR